MQSCDKFVVSLLVIGLVTVALIVLFNPISKNKCTSVEGFADTETRVSTNVPVENYTIYRQIIDEFSLILNRKPTVEELDAYFEKITKESAYDIKNLRNELLMSAEKARLDETSMSVNTTSAKLAETVQSAAKDGRDPKDINVVIDMYQHVFKTNPGTIEVEFYYNKYISYSKDVDRLKKTMTTFKTTDTVGTALSSEIKADKNILDFLDNGGPLTDYFKTDTIAESAQGKAAKCNTTTQVDTGKLTKSIIDSQKQQFNIHKKTFNKLADRQNKRNIDEINYACSRAKKYINSDEDMVLNKEFRWSVPQERPPVCVTSSGKRTPLSDRYSQTALIGTLLDDAENTQVGSIMPKFKYTEELYDDAGADDAGATEYEYETEVEESP